MSTSNTSDGLLFVIALTMPLSTSNKEGDSGNSMRRWAARRRRKCGSKPKKALSAHACNKLMGGADWDRPN